MPPKKLADIVTDYYSNGNPLFYATNTDYTTILSPDDIKTEHSLLEPLSFTATIPIDDMTVYAVLNGRNAGSILGQVLQKLIDKVIFNDPATIIKWKDGTKTVVKCRQGDTYNREVGFMMCIMKYLCGNKSNATKKFIAEHCGEDDEIDYKWEKERLTQYCGISCGKCRLSFANNSSRLYCYDLESECPDLYKRIIRKWAKDCPAKKEGAD